MNKLIFSSLLILSTVSYGAGTSDKLVKFSCEKLVGEWRGSHTYDDGSKSDYLGIYHNNGIFEVHFSSTEVNGETNKTFHQGTWNCRGKEFQTTTEQEPGSTMTFRYRVLYFDGIKMKYQNFSSQEGAGPTFEASKINL